MSDKQDRILGSRTFSVEDQVRFSELSGDCNPLHMDAVAARRSVVGDAVVHGIHTVSWALDAFALTCDVTGRLADIDVRFNQPLFLGETVDVVMKPGNGNPFRLLACVGEKIVAKIDFTLSETDPARIETTAAETLSRLEHPLDLPIAERVGQRDVTAFAAPLEAFAAAFPNAARRFGPAPLRLLAATSCLVGMRCPGLRSLFSRVRLTFSGPGIGGSLGSTLVDFDPRFNLARIEVDSLDARGEIEAFAPPAPVEQPTIRDLRPRIPPAHFADQHALVVGGSRGLGELTAKIVAAGGGNVLLTYARGMQDAARVVDEIVAESGSAKAIGFDVRLPAKEQIAPEDARKITHLYYFATGHIRKPRTALFDYEAFEAFNEFYAKGFFDILSHLRDCGVKNLKILYPSSIAIESRPRGMTEYTMAKAAGEILCADIPALYKGYSCVTPRLPGMTTDQNITVTTAEFSDATDIMLPILLQLR